MAVRPRVMQAGHPMLNWRGIVAGGAGSVAVTVIGATLWNALAYSSGYSWFADNIGWLNAATLIGSFLIGGLLAGFFGRHGALAGFMNGLTMCGGLLAVYVVLGFAAALPLTNLNQANRQTPLGQPGSFWPTFVAYSIGLIAAVGGGVVGALVPRPSRYEDETTIDLRQTSVGVPTEREQLISE
ncbi:MAG: hypothetical protein HYX32_11415 [Actinobacteria bacterium]|nr:hypothetical protein [Actinomycetota bacterium]